MSCPAMHLHRAVLVIWSLHRRGPCAAAPPRHNSTPSQCHPTIDIGDIVNYGAEHSVQQILPYSLLEPWRETWCCHLVRLYGISDELSLCTLAAALHFYGHKCAFQVHLNTLLSYVVLLLISSLWRSWCSFITSAVVAFANLLIKGRKIS